MLYASIIIMSIYLCFLIFFVFQDVLLRGKQHEYQESNPHRKRQAVRSVITGLLASFTFCRGFMSLNVHHTYKNINPLNIMAEYLETNILDFENLLRL